MWGVQVVQDADGVWQIPIVNGVSFLQTNESSGDVQNEGTELEIGLTVPISGGQQVVFSYDRPFGVFSTMDLACDSLAPVVEGGADKSEWFVGGIALGVVLLLLVVVVLYVYERRKRDKKKKLHTTLDQFYYKSTSGQAFDSAVVRTKNVGYIPALDEVDNKDVETAVDWQRGMAYFRHHMGRFNKSHIVRGVESFDIDKLGIRVSQGKDYVHGLE